MRLRSRERGLCAKNIKTARPTSERKEITTIYAAYTGGTLQRAHSTVVPICVCTYIILYTMVVQTCQTFSPVTPPGSSNQLCCIHTYNTVRGNPSRITPRGGTIPRGEGGGTFENERGIKKSCQIKKRVPKKTSIDADDGCRLQFYVLID